MGQNARIVGTNLQVVPTISFLIQILFRKMSKSAYKHLFEEEKLVVSHIENEEEYLTLSSRLADKVAAFGGSWRFIIAFAVIIVLWIVVNVYWLNNRGFDPYPFILLNLILSCVAALQAPVIMMSQNRQEEKDRSRAQNDYLVNLKAEIELRNLHEKVDLLIIEQMKTLFEVQKIQLKKLENIERKLGNTPPQ
jgi:uncharacterized membrane protein